MQKTAHHSGSVLIIDDDIITINMIKAALHRQNFQVYYSTDGSDAVQLVKEFNPDLILLDIMMPSIDGYETCRLLKADNSSMKVPVIFMSALNKTFDKVEAFEAGAVDYVTKPLQAEELIARVRTHVNMFRLSKELIAHKLKLEEKVKERTAELNHQNNEYAILNERLKKKNKELIKAKLKAEESDKLKTEFLHNLSHEIRTPMNGIIGFSEFIDAEDISHEKRKYYSRIIRNSSHQLLRIIDDLLEISVLATHKKEAIEEDVNLNDLLMEMFSIFSLKANEKQISLFVNKSMPNELCTIKTDKKILEKVIGNVIENAIKYTHEGFVEINCEEQNDRIIISVKDTGGGIDAKEADSIFNRFTRSNLSFVKKSGGLGLGLSIAKENIELLKGKISFESELDCGTTFKIEIPNNRPKLAKEASMLDNETDEDIQTILVAEDEEVNYLYLHTLLSEKIDKKYRILHARNGREVLEICASAKKVDLVLMDIKMPEMDGITASKKMKESYPKIPVVAQTAYTSQEDRNIAFLSGCVDFLSKPIERKELFKVINRFV